VGLRRRRDGPPSARGAARHPLNVLTAAVALKDNCRRIPSRTRGARPLTTFLQTASHRLEQSTRPQTIATPCWIPSGWPAWISTTIRTPYYKFSRAFSTASPRAPHPDNIVDDTHAVLAEGTGASRPVVLDSDGPRPQPVRPARLRRRSRFRRLHDSRQVFPAHAQLGSRGFPRLAYFKRPDGGHFAAGRSPSFSNECGLRSARALSKGEL